ncbi:hypothetical protein V1523DRAFT_420800 [Lipomyces doorenjongii]
MTLIQTLKIIKEISRYIRRLSLGTSESIELLLSRRDIDPNRYNRHEMTPLCMATAKGHASAVGLLLHCRNVDTNCRCTTSRYTPLMIAARESTKRLCLYS